MGVRAWYSTVRGVSFGSYDSSIALRLHHTRSESTEWSSDRRVMSLLYT